MPKYECKRTCMWNGRRYEGGKEYDLPVEPERAPKHFLPAVSPRDLPRRMEEEKAKQIVHAFEGMTKEQFIKYLKTLDPQAVRSWPKMAQDKLDEKLKRMKIDWKYRTAPKKKEVT